MSDIAIRVEGISKLFRLGLADHQHDSLIGTLGAMLKAPIRNLQNLRRLSRFDDVLGDGTGTSLPVISRDTDRGSTTHELTGKSCDVLWGLDDVSFEVRHGDVVGIIGSNGAGKSTLLKILSRITEPTRGRAEVYGRVGSLLEVGTGFHPDLTGRENIYLNGTILGMRKREIDARFDEIVEFSGVERFLDTPVKRYSSGMRVRLAFSVAAHLEPEILIIDEVLAVGDVSFQQKCLRKMNDVAKQGRTVLFVSHNMSAVTSLCTSGIVLAAGRKIYEGSSGDAVKSYTQLANQTSPARKGDDCLTVGQVEVNGSRDCAINSGEGFLISVPICGLDGGGLNLFLILDDSNGNNLMQHRLTAQDLGIQNTKGDFFVTAHVPPLWLTAGVYSVYFKFIAIGLSSRNSRVLSERVLLHVHGEMEATGRAVLHPKVEWRMEPESAERR